MNSDRWQEVKRLVEEALELPEEDRVALLAGVGDEELRVAVRGLLEITPTEADAFDRVRFLPASTGIPFKAGDFVGKYEILEEIGCGGMGVVFKADDHGLRGTVALKVLPPRVLSVSANEDATLARLSHPNIAAFYESGETEEGFRFLAMEYVEGKPITSYCAEKRLALPARLTLFRQVCGAVEYAHQRFIVHRDLKPENILVTYEGEPKLLDFGIAKVLRPGSLHPTLTRLADRPLTVAFASPEQLGGDHTRVTSDVYSLGVLLCLLLTGKLPYKVASSDELPWAIRNMEPIRPSALVPLNKEGLRETPATDGNAKRLRRRLEGDLDAIVLRALRKNPEERYPSVAELSEDIRRYLDREPVLARQGSRRYFAAKFVQRHRWGVASGLTFLLVLLALITALFFTQREAIRERDAARREAARAERVSGFLVDMFRVSNPWTKAGTPTTAREVLDTAARKLESSPPEDSIVRGSLLHSLGRINLSLGAYSSAEALLQPALLNLRLNADRNRHLIAETLADLARVRYHQARYTEAEHYALDAIHDFNEGFGMRTLLGRIAFARGDYIRAEALFREAWDIDRKSLAPFSVRASNSAHDLACALHAEGRYAEAAALYDQSLLTRRRLLGENHYATLQVLENLALLVQDRGHLEEAQNRLVSVRLKYRDLGDPDFPSLPALFHNLGSGFISLGKLDQAEEILFDSLAGYRSLLPDDHPNVGRALSEVGRFYDARRKYAEAERYYREGFRRLEACLGRDHPDTIAVMNNLAVLRAREGKTREAEALWREALGRAEAHRVRPALLAVLRKNLALRQDAVGATGRYHTAGIEILDLTETPDSYEASWAAQHRGDPGKDAPVLLFSDDFNDGRIDPEKWEARGRTVREENGELQVLMAVTDHGGQVSTLPIAIDPTRTLAISRRVRIHAANSFYDGKMAVGITGYPEKNFGVSYANYRYTGGGESVTVGISIYRHNANSHRFADRRANVSPLIPPLWDRWFEETLLFDPRTGEVRYSIDGKERLAYNVGPLPANASTITLTFFPWGWYTGHSQEMDWVRVEQ